MQWHCTNCGYETNTPPKSCPLCKSKESFTNQSKPKKKRNSYDDILDEMKKYEEGCDPQTTKSGSDE